MNTVADIEIDQYQQWFQGAVLSRRRGAVMECDCETRLVSLRQRMKAQIQEWHTELGSLQSRATGKAPDVYQRLNRLRMDTHGRLLSWKLEAEVLRGHITRQAGNSEELKASILSVCAAIEGQIRHWETGITHVRTETERVEAEAIWQSYLAAIQVAADAEAASLDDLYRDWDVAARQW